MLSNTKIQEILQEIREISRAELALYDEKGRLLAGTFDPGVVVAAEAEAFAVSEADSQELEGFYFFKIREEETVRFCLLIPADAAQGYLVGRMTAQEIKRLSDAYREQTDRSTFIQNVLLGNYLAVDMYNKAEKLKIRQARRICYVVETEGKKDAALLVAVRSLVDSREKDFVTELDERSVVVVKDARNFHTEEDEENFAKMLSDTVHGEIMIPVRVGFGNPAESLGELQRSYQEAQMSLEVGRIFYAGQVTISYRKLGIGRLIYQLPESLCVMFIREVFGDREPKIDEESYLAVEKFFQNSLNISETARQLYVHRNTLVYRLDRFQKEVGLDVRNFEEAMTFKIAMMVRAHLNYIREWNTKTDKEK